MLLINWPLLINRNFDVHCAICAIEAAICAIEAPLAWSQVSAAFHCA